jgi:spore coat protein CotH
LVKKSLIALTEVIPILKTAEDNSETSSQIRDIISTHFDVDSLIDFQIFSDVSANTDGAKKNWQWNTWDGSKWACSPYDLDWTFGLRGSYSDQEPLSAHIEGTNRSLPCYWIITYFNTELEARYAELRRMKIIDADYLAEKLNNWTLRVGFDNYNNELKKWPERRSDNIYRFRNWCATSISNMDIIYNYNQN